MKSYIHFIEVGCKKKKIIGEIAPKLIISLSESCIGESTYYPYPKIWFYPCNLQKPTILYFNENIYKTETGKDKTGCYLLESQVVRYENFVYT